MADSPLPPFSEARASALKRNLLARHVGPISRHHAPQITVLLHTRAAKRDLQYQIT
jgi:hypothetical protein